MKNEENGACGCEKDLVEEANEIVNNVEGYGRAEHREKAREVKAAFGGDGNTDDYDEENSDESSVGCDEDIDDSNRTNEDDLEDDDIDESYEGEDDGSNDECGCDKE